MTKKVNPIVFRLGVKNQWDSSFYEKKPQESSAFSYVSMQLNNFVKLILRRYGLELTNLKIYLKKNSLSLLITYVHDKKKIFLNSLQNKIRSKATSNFLSVFSKNRKKFSSLFFLKKWKNNQKKIKTFNFFLIKTKKIKKIYSSNLKFRSFFEKKRFRMKAGSFVKYSNVLKQRFFTTKYYKF